MDILDLKYTFMFRFFEEWKKLKEVFSSWKLLYFSGLLANH